MDFSLSSEERMIRDTVRQFIANEVMPVEPEVLKNERNGRPAISDDTLKRLQDKAKTLGFWGINTPKQYGGAELGWLMTALIYVELGRTYVPFMFGGSADNILYEGSKEQQERYLLPTIAGDRRSCFALTEPGVGSDAGNIRTLAVKEGKHWVINGEKIFITNGNEADFCMVLAVTDRSKGPHQGISCFLVDRDMGWRSTPIQTMGEWTPASLVLDNVRVPEENLLGEEGHGLALGMRRIGHARWAIAARAVGAAERLLEMAIQQANTRVTFGQPLADRQAIQWMIADSTVEIEATKWMTYRAAWMLDQGVDNRHMASMSKLYGGRHGQPRGRPCAANPWRHGIHKRLADRTVVPGYAAV